MLLVPAADPPLKRQGRLALAPATLRAHWAELAVKDHPRLAVDRLELEREGPSYTVDTLRILRERLREPLVFVIGQDAFAELPAWREPERLLTLCDFAVMSRPPASGGSLFEWIPPGLAAAFELEPDGQTARHRTAKTRIVRLEIDALDISATEVRARIRGGRPVDDLLPPAVAEAVLASGCYATGDEDQ